MKFTPCYVLRNHRKMCKNFLGHASVSTTMNIYIHAPREAKRTSARLLDKVVGEG
jgi:integrase